MRLAVLVLVGACGFTAPRHEPSEPNLDAYVPQLPTIDAPPRTPQSFLTDLVTLECQQAFACMPQYPQDAYKSFADAWGSDVHDCVVTDRDYLARDSVAASVMTGTISWDPAAAMQCLAAPGIPTSCQALFSQNYSYSDACMTALAGKVPDGGSCTNDWECGRYSDCRSARCTR